MANGGRIQYTVGFNVDQSGLNQIKQSLQAIQNASVKDLVNVQGLQNADQRLKEIKHTASEVQGALERSFNSDLGTLNVSKFNQELKKLDVKRIYTDFNQVGVSGQNAFRNITSQVLTTNLQLKQTNKWLDEMATTMTNTVRWGLTSSIWNTMTNAVSQSFNFAKKLDTSLNDIRIVTGKSADEMERFALQANRAAKDLGQSTTAYTNASLIYYQQGLSDEETKARTETTLKAANVTGQSAAEVSEQLTAVWNGYKVNAEEAELYVDKLAAVAATTAADLEELSTGMSKVASAANIMGVDMDQLNAQLATIVSVTRQAPESVGTALKTIYARMGDIEAGIDTETTLGNYTEQMAEMGFNVLDTNGALRDMGDVIEEIGGKWSTLSREQQVALSQTMAGTRQYNNLLSLFDNWDMYTESLETSAEAAGTLQNQQDTYMESMEAHLKQLSAAGEGVYNALFNAEDLNPVLDSLTGVVNLFKNVIDGVGGAQGALLLLGNIGTQVFSKQLASGIATMVSNFQAAKNNAHQLQAEMEILTQYENANINDSRTQNLINMKREILDYDKVITAEERNQANEIIRQTNELYKQQDVLQNKKTQIRDIYNQMTGEVLLFDEGEDSVLSEEQLTVYSKKIEAEVNTITNNLSKAKTEAQRFDQAIQNMNKAEKEYNKDVNSIEKMEEFCKAIDKVNESMNEYRDYTREILKENALSAEQRERLTEALTKYKTVAKQVANGQAEHTEKVNAAQILQRTYNNILRENSEALKQAQHSLKGMKQEQDNLNNSLKAGEQAWKSYISQVNLKAKAQQIVNFANGLGRVSMTLSSLGRIDDIFKDVNLSAGEKLLQLMTALSMTIPGVVAIASAIGKVTGATGLLQAKLALMVITQEKEAAARAKSTIVQKLGNDTTEQTLRLLETEEWARKEKIGALSKEVALEKAEDLITKAGIPTDSLEAELIRKEILLRHANAAAINKENIFKALQEKLTWANIKAKLVELKTKAKDLWSSFNGLTGGAKIFAGALGAIAVTAAITAGTLAFVNRDINQLTEEAKKASESLNTLTETYDAAKTAFENFQSEISDYKEAKTALDDMVTGTEEWKNAVEDVNKQVIDLISNYKELAPYVQKSETGELSISEEGMRIVERLERDKLNNQYQQLNAARINNSKAQSELSIGQTKEDMEVFGDFAAGSISATGGLVGAIVGGLTGFIAGPLGIIVGAAIGAAGGGIISAVTEEIANVQEEDIKAVTEAYATYGEALFDEGQFEKIMSKASGVTENEIKALWANREKLIELSRSVDANTQAQQAYMQQYVQSALEGNEIYETSKDKQDLEKMVAAATNKNLDTFVDKWADKLGGKTDEEIQKAYAKLMEWETTSIDNQTGNKATYYFSDGTSKTIDDATARYALAMAEASENATESLREFQLAIDTTNQKLNTEGLDNEMLSTFFEGKVGDLSNYTGAEVEKLSGIVFTDEEAIARGYESAQDLQDKIIEASQNYEKWLTEIDNKTSSIVGENLLKLTAGIIEINKLSLVARDNLSKAIIDAFKYGGDEGLNALLEMVQNVPEDKMEDFLALVGNIDFTNANAFDDLKKKIQELDVELSELDGFDNWGKIVEETIERNQTLESSMDRLIAKYQIAAEILNEISFGEIIDKEKYQGIIKYNQNLADSFQLLSDGNYRFIGWDQGDWKGIEGSYDALDEAEEYLNEIERQKKIKESQEKLLNNNFNNLNSKIKIENSKYFEDIYKQRDSLYWMFEEFDRQNEFNPFQAGKGKKLKQEWDSLFDEYLIAKNEEDRKNILAKINDFRQKNAGTLASVYTFLEKQTDTIKEFSEDISIGDDSQRIEALNKAKNNILSMNIQDLSATGLWSENYLEYFFSQISNLDPNDLKDYDILYEKISEFYDQLEVFSQKNISIRDLSAENEILTQTTSLEELNAVFTRGIGTMDGYLKQYQYLSREMALAAGVEEEQIQLYKDKIDAIDGMTNHMAEAAAAQILLTQVGLKDLADNWEDQLSKISSLDEFAPDYINAVDQVAESLSQVFAVEKDFFTDDFIKAHQEDITKIVNGDEEAFDHLKDIVTDKVQASLKQDLMKSGGADLVSDFDSLIDQLQNHLDTLSFGDKIDETFSEQMATILIKAGKTSAQIMSIFSSMGIAINESWLKYLEIKNLMEQGNYENIVAEYGNDFQKTNLRLAKQYGGSQLSSTYFKQTAKDILNSYKIESSDAEAIFAGTEDMLDSLLPSDNKKSNDPDQIEYLEDKLDIYHDINIEIQNITTALEALEKEQDKLFGQDFFDNLEKQFDLLDKQAQAVEKKQKIAQIEANRLKIGLAQDEVQFDKDGNITNYFDIIEKKRQALNRLIYKYNGADAETQEALKESVENAEKKFEEFQENIERYETIVTEEIPEMTAEIRELAYQQIETRVQRFDTELEVSLDMKEAEREWNEFVKNVLNDIGEKDILGNTESLLADFESYYDAAGTGEVQVNTDRVNKIMEAMRAGQNGEEGMFSTYDELGNFVYDEAAAIEALKEAQQGLMGSLTGVDEIINQINEAYINGMEQASQAFDDQIAAYESVANQIEHNMKLIELIYGEDSYEELGNYFKEQADNYVKQADFLRQEIGYWENRIADAQARVNSATTGEEKERAEEELRMAQEEWQNAINDLNSTVEAAVENLQAKYANSLNQIFKEMGDKLTNGLGLEYASEEWDLINKNADRYLDTINSTYEVQKLANKYTDAINNTDSLSAQKKLNDFMEDELKMLREKDKLSQYDIDRANKKYDLMLKEIALEEARQNASSMRLRRDSQGNYSYQFVADEDSVAQAENDLLAAQNDLYNFDKEAYKANLDEMYQAYEEYQQKMLEAAQINDPEERAERERLITEEYSELINGIVADNESIRANLQESTFLSLAGLYTTDVENFEAMTGMNAENFAEMMGLNLSELSNLSIANIDTYTKMAGDQALILTEQMVPNFSSAMQTMIDNINGEGGFGPIAKQVWEDIKIKAAEYQTALAELEEASGKNFDEISKGMDPVLEKTKELIQDNDDLIKKYEEEWDAIEGVVRRLEQLVDAYAAAEEAAEQAAAAAEEALRKAQEAIAGISDIEYNNPDGNDTPDVPGQGGTPDYPGSTGGSGGGSGGGESFETKEDNFYGDYPYYLTTGHKLVWEGINDSASGFTRLASSFPVKPAGMPMSAVEQGGWKDFALKVSPYKQRGSSSGFYFRQVESYKGDKAFIAEEDIKKLNHFDTGGYTGEWGSDGRVAMLHQKEIVLNAKDTENLLSAVNIVRSLGDMVKNLSAALASNLTPAAVPVGRNLGSDSIEQNVHITAEFPNVSSSSEIEQALRNLTNVASQRAFNTRR